VHRESQRAQTGEQVAPGCRLCHFDPHDWQRFGEEITAEGFRVGRVGDIQ
jgi:hypothetical protein